MITNIRYVNTSVYAKSSQLLCMNVAITMLAVVRTLTVLQSCRSTRGYDCLVYTTAAIGHNSHSSKLVIS